MNYSKLIADAAAKLNSLVNEICDMFEKAGTPINPGRIIGDIISKAFPEENGVIQLDRVEPLTEEQAENLDSLLAEFKDTPNITNAVQGVM